MPNALTHSILTRAALALQKFDTGDCENLINDYCNYPDRADAAEYDLPTDGIQFHYLPDSSVNELYRYWKRENGSLSQCRSFVNENFFHVTAGVERYLDLTLSNFRLGNDEEARKYLGCMLHVMEDATFGLHTLEGYLGSDPFILDRLSGEAVSDMLAAIQLKEMPELPEYEPVALGNTPAEAVMRIYKAYCSYSMASRQCVFRYVISKLYGSGDADIEIRKMFDNAVKLASDIIFTGHVLAENTSPAHPQSLPLTELEPYQFPFGGCNGYRYRAYSVNFALDGNSAPMPLKIGDKEYSDGIAFAAHHEGALRYFIGAGVFSKFTCRIGLHPACPMKKAVDLTILNHGEVIQVIKLDKDHAQYDLTIDEPVGEFGLRYRCSPTSGEVVVIADPCLFYH